MFFYFKVLFSKFWTNLCIRLYCDKWSKIIVCDIDNTIADTWKNIEDEKIPYSRLPYFDDVLKFIFSEKDNKTGIIFLSFRPQKKFIISKKWLTKIGFKISIFQLVLCPSANFKVYFLKKMISLNKKILFIDDLSYNQEHGEIKFYNYVLNELKKLNIDYLGYDKLKILQYESTNIEL